MALKVGNRVTVLAGGPDENTGDGFPVTRYTGRVGEVVQLGEDGPVPCPDNDMVLVDDQIVNGKPVGSCTLREWFRPECLEVG